MKARHLAIVLLLSLATLVSAQKSSTSQSLTVPDTGLTFDYPKAWKTTKTKSESKLMIPMVGTSEMAVLHVFSIEFRAEIPRWEDAQVDISHQFHRTLIRQWQEQILNVPMLLSKASYIDKGVPRVVLTGLLYTASPRKLLFRLEAPAQGYDDVETAWRNAFLTLRTTDGSDLKADNPNRNLTAEELKPKPSKPEKVTTIDAANKVKLEKGKVKIQAETAKRKVVISVPQGWTAESQPDGTWNLKNPQVSVIIHLSLASTLDSDPAERALFKMSSQSLNEFSAVKDRSETAGRANKAGQNLDVIWRSGQSASGSLTTLEGYVASGEFYLLGTTRFTGVAPTEQQKKAITDLFDMMAVDQAP